ncbi:MAG: hypothetical protein VB012_03985 [Erysipelotrichaceae bacterium]|nr:hypothetical protein [Erysipelotrichaceae bacterium]
MKPVIRIVVIGMLAALTMASQVIMSSLPNVELVTLLFIIYALNLDRGSSLMIVCTFTVLEGLIWGFGDWVFGYFWIWSLMVITVRALKPLLKDNTDGWALFAGFWGLAFGSLFALQWAVMYGVTAGYAYWIKGIVFDLIHMLGNYIIVLILFQPVSNLFRKLYQRLEVAYGHHNQKR